MGVLIGVIALMVAWAILGLLTWFLYEYRWKPHAALDEAHRDSTERSPNG